MVRKEDKEPFYNHARDGSIILVHGNGNEPGGITALERWLEDHRDWNLGLCTVFYLRNDTGFGILAIMPGATPLPVLLRRGRHNRRSGRRRNDGGRWQTRRFRCGWIAWPRCRSCSPRSRSARMSGIRCGVRS